MLAGTRFTDWSRAVRRPIFGSCWLASGCVCAAARFRRLGDIATGTVVICIPKPRPPQLENAETEKYNSLREGKTLTARLRQEVSPDMADVALQAIQRRSTFAPEARLQLFSELAAHFKKLVRIPGEALHGISDERLIVNIVDIFFRGEKKKATGKVGNRKA